MSSLWLSKKKKGELVELCEQLGLESDGYLKGELEVILSEYLDVHSADLTADATFSSYYDTIATRSTPKPASSITSSTNEPNGTGRPTRKRRTTQNYRNAINLDAASTQDEASPEPIEKPDRKTRASSRALSTRTPRQVRNLRDAGAVPLPPSPAVVTDAIEARANALLASARESFEKADLDKKAANVRNNLSNSVSVNAVALAIEYAFLLSKIMPMTKSIAVPIGFIGSAHSQSKTVFLPDLFVILTAAFWGPFLTWFSTAFLVPLANAALFNLVATGAKDKSYRTWKVDPLTFAVTKALVAYLVFYNGAAKGVFGEQSVETVGESVGPQMQIIGAGIAGVAAVWEGILRK